MKSIRHSKLSVSTDNRDLMSLANAIDSDNLTTTQGRLAFAENKAAKRF